MNDKEKGTFQFNWVLQNIREELAGYFTWYNYSIPLVIYTPTENDIIDPVKDLLFEECVVDNPSLGRMSCIMISRYVWGNLSFKYITDLVYTKIAKLIYPMYFNDYRADEFAASHIGETELIDAYNAYDDVLSRYQCNVGMDVFYMPDMILTDYRESTIKGFSKKIKLTKDTKINFIKE